jgi:uncharacterized protein (UPF0332 family)
LTKNKFRKFCVLFKGKGDRSARTLEFERSLGVEPDLDDEVSNRGRCDRLVKMVLFGSQARGDADYGQLNAVTAQQANEQITRAEQFLELADNLIGTIPPNS